MKLSDMVRLRNELERINFVPVRTETNLIDGLLSHLLELPAHLTYREDLNKLINNVDVIENTIDSLESDIPAIISKLDQEILDNTQEYLARGYMINGFYGSNSTNVATEREERILNINDDTRSELLVRARGYTDWRYPGLEIGPGDGQWTEHLIAADPLYVIDVHQEFLDSTVSKFNDVYRNRIRPYLTGMTVNRSDTDLSMLPRNQFGFIFSWNVFDYFPLAHTKAFLTQAFDLLRPGGVMMFSYNNCEIPQCVEYVEIGFKSWMPKSLLVATCRELGFEIIKTHNPELTVNWIEIRKPGELKTVKGHQVLGEIISL